jgi:hypothetical protein
MAISLIGAAASAGNASITIPGSYQAGDLLVIYAFNDSTTTPPTAVSGWTSLGTSGAASCASITAWKVAGSNSEVSGTWTGATSIASAVYRGQATNKTPIIGVNAGAYNSNTGSALLYQPDDPLTCPSSSWIVAFAAIKSINTNIATAPTLTAGYGTMTNEATSTGATDQIVLHDSNGSNMVRYATTSGGALLVTLTGTTASWNTGSFEILAEFGGLKNNHGIRPHPFSPGLAR